MDLFFYGTLMDTDVRRLALGGPDGGLAIAPARLHGFRRMAKLRSSAPVLVRRAGAAVTGILVRGVGEEQLARLSHFEGSRYRLDTCALRDDRDRPVRTLVFFGAGRIPVRRVAWRLAPWQRRHKRVFLRLMTLWMAAYREAGYRTRGRRRWIRRWAAGR